ncbi:cytochrome c oxidase subunit 4 [Demequina aurantiaca]|uniref:cytochrome c oxidase subunit 4 n=1 Tax=Demequina aurantiaca TaxID=676200 RepID=UPI003D343847
MNIAAKLFNLPAIFFLVVAVLYGIFNGWEEWVGFVAILLTGGLFLMIGVYFYMLDKRHGVRPEDRNDGEIIETGGEQGVYAPWSWWPLVLAASAALGFTALAVGWWILWPAIFVFIIGIVGWVFEFSRGQHAH